MKIVIFAGGVGTRLWPLSRKKTPKQFEKIIGDKSTIQSAVERVLPIINPSDLYISSGEVYKDILFEQLPQIPRENFILEPTMRDVGAAVGLVAAILEKESPNEPFIILWSDHIVKNEALFQKILVTAGKLLEEEKNKIVFIGENSRFPSQNLGWIEFGNEEKNLEGISIHGLKSFHYRPTLEVAEKFHESPNHVWNTGYFATTASFLFSLYKKFSPEMYTNLLDLQKVWKTQDFDEELKKIYPSLEKISFDNLILEKISPSDGLVIAQNLKWSDIGAWESLKEALSETEEQNITKGKVMVIDSKDSLAYNYTDQMLVGIDMEDLLVINTEDVILICPKKSVPKIKKFVESLNGTENEGLA